MKNDCTKGPDIRFRTIGYISEKFRAHVTRSANNLHQGPIVVSENETNCIMKMKSAGFGTHRTS